MAKGINSVQLLGNLGHAPEMRYTAGGKAVTTFSVAVDHPTTNAAGERGTATDWFKVVAWDKLAEHANQYLDRGSKVFVQGRLQTRSWEADGQKHYATEIVAEDIVFLSPRPAGAPSADAPAADEEEGLPF